ncbi:DegT/DnrJ/EryC1/StrS family aminotransferase [Nonomuraea sp. NPDC050478]|uniref:DegT/DnrJ/EryC1/StrS family aminotransferase n=1 Tax=Nonomuraea sp. NPDC050478 TaxID=3364365 RepID=UPI0037BC4292
MRATELEARMGERLGQGCLHVPSARFGLLLALRHWFRPGDRVLIAPTNCETVLFVALAAGLTPVMAPVSARDGNIDVDRVDWSGLAGMLTTHLYGVPDRVARLRAACDRHGLVLVDDAAHAFQTEADGRPAGLWGEAGVFSLAKHGRAMSGGFLTAADPAALRELAAAREELLLPGPARAQVSAVLRPLLREAVYRTGLVRPVWHTLKRLGLMTWTGHRYPTTAGEVAKAAGDLDAMDPWLRIDLDDWRMRPGRALLRLHRSRIRAIGRERERRLAGVAALRATPWAAPGVTDAPVRPLLRVPLLVADRDRVVAALESHGVVPGFVYDPPLDDYLTTILPADPLDAHPSIPPADPLDGDRPIPTADRLDADRLFPTGPTPGVARWWTGHVLPADPLDAGRLIPLLERLGVRPPLEGPPPDDE